MDADHRAPRLFVDADLYKDQRVTLGREQSHYLLSVMRCKTGALVRLFNGRDGEWRGHVLEGSRKDAVVALTQQMRPQVALGRISWLFAPLKQARLDYMVQKAVEMGVASIQPVLTQHTVVQRLNLERMQANAIEAAEQCHLLAVPVILPDIKLDKALSSLPETGYLVFCDEGAELAPPLEALRDVPPDVPVAVLIGPEGGFSDKERQAILALPRVIRLSLGPRIMRADTAAVAALTLVQAICGDLA